ncbi:MAG: hypothetical protein MJ177_10430, partial [Clostridia bacterium]|nr:hypothetical protein [Clostridia bacterium]
VLTPPVGKMALTTDGFTVESSERWQQFLIYNVNDGSVLPYSADKEIKDSTSEIIMKLLLMLRNLLINLLRTVGVVSDNWTSPFSE